MRHIRVIGPGKKGDGCGNLEQKNHGPAFLPFNLRDPNAKDGGAAWWAPWPPPRPAPLNSPPTPTLGLPLGPSPSGPRALTSRLRAALRAELHCLDSSTRPSDCFCAPPNEASRSGRCAELRAWGARALTPPPARPTREGGAWGSCGLPRPGGHAASRPRRGPSGGRCGSAAAPPRWVEVARGAWARARLLGRGREARLRGPGRSAGGGRPAPWAGLGGAFGLGDRVLPVEGDLGSHLSRELQTLNKGSLSPSCINEVSPSLRINEPPRSQADWKVRRARSCPRG
ncbi:translation initiation factor IF-2-like [Orcinus orca]|uniref:translation initiation factor IF-2-like n=1 Tax=Orcinus orca TaxID=9733 RepID=UPI0021134655|nr:translation initiation factor IF-2-like [Orcinus orca]